MADYLVDCVLKTSPQHEAITHIGGPTVTARWQLTKAEAIKRIDNKTDTFHTKVDGVRANIGVNGTAPNRYLQTHADGKWSNNLLALPSCG